MKKSVYVLLLTLMVSALWAENNWSKFYEKYHNKLVLIQYYESITSFEGIKDKERLKRYLTGIVVDDKGLVMTTTDIYRANIEFSSTTNLFMSGEIPSEITVKFEDGKEIPAEFVGKDDDLGIAFIRMSGEFNAEPVEFLSEKDLKIGQPVLILQHLPSSYDFALTMFERRINAIVKKQKAVYYCEDKMPSVSNFGLAFDLKGNALGFYLKKGQRRRVGMRFGAGGDAIMGKIIVYDEFKSLIEKPPVFRQKETNRKKWLGVYMQPFTRDLAEYFGQPDVKGILINTVIKNSPAQKAGLLPGDVITKINEVTVEAEKDSDLDGFRQIIRNQSEESINMEIFRGNHFITKKVMLSSSPISQYLAEEAVNTELGFSVKELTRDIILAKNLDPETQGVWVSRVEQAAWADVAGLRIGDLIKGINEQEINSLEDVRVAFKQIAEQKPAFVKLFIERQGGTLFLFIKTNYNDSNN
ncbi:MAG: PDZ domain-containing protein [Calditrichaeota bacterium]|nr:PDZ domain-containing protein [Calditrichota bacterium]